MNEKYVPNYGDLERFRYERLIRTKSRAYQMACWQGYLGTHDFFLGNNLRGWATLLLAMATVPLLVYEWILGLLLLILVIGLNITAVRAIAVSDPNSDIYGEECGPVFHSLHMVGSFSIMWDINLWKGKTPTDPPPPDMD
ncbi:hypothetical protein [Rothia sp. (in: high G+C Gram-positive bacteria)]|uniref:hypothetical protein n=1 Tax=Rothia sp. (in: high G+C Gram-positive bacteria) TaxID=1885016 RepID=UPI003217EC02